MDKEHKDWLKTECNKLLIGRCSDSVCYKRGMEKRKSFQGRTQVTCIPLEIHDAMIDMEEGIADLQTYIDQM